MTIRRILLVAGLLTLQLTFGYICAADTPPVPSDITIEITTQDPANAFVSKDGTLSGPIIVTAILRNKSAGDEKVVTCFTLSNYWGQVLDKSADEVADVPGGQSASVNYSFAPSKFGAYVVLTHLSGASVPADSELVAIVVPPPHDGLRPESFFASNTYMTSGVELHQKIGLKVYRQHFADATHSIVSIPGASARKPSDPFQFDFADQDKYVADAAAAGISIVGLVGYANQQWGLSDEGRAMHMYGPPRDINEFINATVPVVAHFKSIKYWEFWNEPWIYGWTWAGTPTLYRQFQGQWIRAAKHVRPDIKVIAGNSASFLEDDIEPGPKAYKGLLDADSNHPYRDGYDPTDRPGGQQRYIDFGVQEASRMGIKMHFVTENGTEVRNLSGPPVHDDPLNAPKLVIMHVIGALAGLYQENVQQDIGWGPQQMRGSAAYAIMTHFLEDRVPVADIWPKQSLIWGAIFSNNKLADSSLPRSSVLKARWGVDGIPGDNTKVAVLWNYTGLNQRHLDTDGTITLSPAGDLAAFDLMGNPTGTRSGDSLTLPFTKYPVYVTTTALSVKEFDDLVGSGKIENVTPINMSVYSFDKPLEQNPSVVVRCENQMNRPVTGTLTVTMPGGWSGVTTKKVTLLPAELTDITFPVTAAIKSNTNLYDVNVTADTDAGSATISQVVQVAYAPERTIKVDGNLDDWADVVPVTIDSNYQSGGSDWTRAVLNPNLPKQQDPAGPEHVIVKSYAAWDATNFYAAFKVIEPQLASTAGTDYTDSKYKHGMLNGVDFPFYIGDSVEFGFGINQRAEDDYHKSGDPWYFKGDFRDTDYLYIAYPSALGPQLIRLHKPGIPFRDGFQTEAPVGQGAIRGSRIVITRQGDASVYELSIPRSELKLFSPEKMPRIRFGFVVSDSAKANDGALLEWSKTAGVFDYWLNNGSYQPTWQSLYAAQTAWGFGP
jgi:hypothetical protein